ncbi:MAG TPA: rRNA maturation RNase YbeY [Holophagaceae bacterium]|jgi:probable rRNA maturation factor|nr:rRNA maturation RNase YbeY [Holophagaceae bacterium]
MAGVSAPFQIDWASRSSLRGPSEKSLGDLVRSLKDRLAPQALGISITYVDDRGMKKLNREHRGKNETTDVLSFPTEAGKGEFPHLGDIVISLPVAEAMAKKLGVSRRREVETLVIHGFLHLCGYDHEKDNGEMLALQSELETQLLGEAPLPMSLKRGRKAGSRVKVLKDGTRKVVTGRAAAAITRKAEEQKVQKAKKAKKASGKPAKKAGKKVRAVKPIVLGEAKRGPGRPRKGESPAVVRKVVRRKVPSLRSPVIA